MFNVKPLGKKEPFSFQCKRCSDCCRHIKEQIMLESLDAYHLARWLRQSDPTLQSIGDLWERYTIPVPLTDEGYPIFVLKSIGEDDACVFLGENGCTVYENRPRTCRLYPLTAAPGCNGRDFEYLLCTEKPHHFEGNMVRTKDWLRENFKREAQEFVQAEYVVAPEIGKLMRAVPRRQLPAMLVALMQNRYYDFDLDEAFMPQYKKNMERLKETLAELR